MPALATLVDDFDDNTVNETLWPESYGTYSEVGGRARVQCDPAFGAYSSAAAYSLAASSVYVRVYPPAAAGATTTAYAQVSVLSTVEGTEIGARIDTVTNTLRLQSNTDYWDDAAVSLTYNATSHAYVRISEAGGTVTWATSPDGSTWTTRRTLATPAWVTTTTTSELRLETYRNNGTNNYAEFDNLNTLPVTPGPSDAKKAAFLAFL